MTAGGFSSRSPSAQQPPAAAFALQQEVSCVIDAGRMNNARLMRFAGIAITGSSFFTALNNGLVSALISFLRTFLFQVAGRARYHD